MQNFFGVDQQAKCTEWKPIGQSSDLCKKLAELHDELSRRRTLQHFEQLK